MTAQHNMKSKTKLTLIKSIHTLIWLFFNVVIFYMLYAAIANKLNIWLWIGYGFVCLEGLILLTFKSHCPLNLLARKYSNSTKDNFDIYLPSWLAKDRGLNKTDKLFVGRGAQPCAPTENAAVIKFLFLST